MSFRRSSAGEGAFSLSGRKFNICQVDTETAKLCRHRLPRTSGPLASLLTHGARRC